jgi:uncharacterized membrane protein
MVKEIPSLGNIGRTKTSTDLTNTIEKLSTEEKLIERVGISIVLITTLLTIILWYVLGYNNKEHCNTDRMLFENGGKFLIAFMVFLLTRVLVYKSDNKNKKYIENNY